jgi:hypothetical protein
MVFHNRISKGLISLVFSFFLLINVLSTGGHFDWRDGVETFVVTESMIIKSSAKSHSDVPSVKELYGKSYDQHNISSALQPYYGPRSLLLSAIAVPFYLAATTVLSISPILVTGLFVNSIIIALISLVVFLFSLEMYGSKRIAFILGLILNVCSFLWPYNTSLYPQPLQALLIFAPAYFIYISLHSYPSSICYHTRTRNGVYNNTAVERRVLIFAMVGGILLGFSVFAHPSSIIVIPGFIVYFIYSIPGRSKKMLASFLVSLAAVLIFMGLVNFWRFGSFSEFGYYGYGSLLVHGGWEGLIGLWVSPGHGLLFYFPIVILLPFALKRMSRYKENRRVAFLIIYITAINWLFVGTLSYDEPISWSGAFAWGPRYMILLLPFFVLSLGSILTWLKRGKLHIIKLSVIILLCVFGFGINLIGKLVWVSYVANYIWETYKLQMLYTNYWSIVTWNPFFSTILLHYRVLMDSDFVSEIKPTNYSGTVNHYVNYGLIPCSYDLYIFCKFGILPVLGISGIAIFLCTIILWVKKRDDVCKWSTFGKKQLQII